MPIRESDGGIGAAVNEIAVHARSIARLELRLAAAELKQKLVALGVGVALAVAAAVLGLFAAGFALATIAAALALVMPIWLALLVATLACGGVALLLGVFGLSAVRHGSPPVPRAAIEDAKLTAQAVTRNGPEHGSS
jgi:Putative Actinobacterial Holin-X, holin superfamily III